MEIIKLTKKQTKHKGAFRWLLNPIGNRGDGRSFLMALTFVETATEYPNVEIKIFDHFPHRHADRVLLDTVQEIIEGLPKKTRERFKISHCRNSIEYD